MSSKFHNRHLARFRSIHHVLTMPTKARNLPRRLHGYWQYAFNANDFGLAR